MGFLQDTAVEALGNGRYRGRIAAGWDVVGNANGGYLLGIAGRAMTLESGRPNPVALNAHFLSPGRPGEVTVEVETVKSGNRFTTLRGTMLDASGKSMISLLGSFGDLAQLEGPQRIDAAPPDLPPPDECPRSEASETGFPPAMLSKIELRMHPEDGGFFQGSPTQTPLFRGWFRLLDGEPIDTIALLLAVDAFPPPVFNANLPIAWAPTLELTTHIRGNPAPGWLRCRFSSRFISGGLVEEDGEVWDDTGRLVAQSRQLALAPKP
ncbi:MAG: thioesterase family protein [Halieaceae bacterium]|jgi:acyl-CoA thioesterase|nr:thioesterase family protein [Halieaceae bacterium]